MIASARPAPNTIIQIRCGSSSTSAAMVSATDAEHDRHVRDLARQALLVQVDPGERHERGAEDAERRQLRLGAELQAEQHEERRSCELDDDRFDADRVPAVPALAAQHQPAQHRHQVACAQPQPARAARARRGHDRRATWHAIDDDRQERPDHQPHHGAADNHEGRFHHIHHTNICNPRPQMARAGG